MFSKYFVGGILVDFGKFVVDFLWVVFGVYIFEGGDYVNFVRLLWLVLWVG